MPEEIFDVVDEHDQVIAQAPRSEVHARRLLHRAAHVFVFDTQGRLLLQMRSATKDEYPSVYTSSSSGHLSAGESYDEAAPRELEEEIGITAPIEYLTKLPATPELANEHSALYRTITDETPNFDPEEVAGGEYFDIASLTELLDREPEQFASPFRVLFRWYLKTVAASG